MKYRLPTIVRIKSFVIVLVLTLTQYAQAGYLPKSKGQYILLIPQDYFNTAISIDPTSLVVEILNHPSEFVQQDLFTRRYHAELQLRKKQEEKKFLKKVDDLLENIQAKKVLAEGEKNITKLSPKQSTGKLSKKIADAQEVPRLRPDQDQKIKVSTKEKNPSDTEISRQHPSGQKQEEMVSTLEEYPSERKNSGIVLKDGVGNILINMLDVQVIKEPKFNYTPKEKKNTPPLQIQSTVAILEESALPWTAVQRFRVVQNINNETVGKEQQLFFQESEMLVSPNSHEAIINSQTLHLEQISWPWIIEYIINICDYIAQHKSISLLSFLVTVFLFNIRR